MKLLRAPLYSFILGLVFLAGCGGGDGGGGITPPPVNNDELLTSVAIGTEGGTIAADELAVTVPAGTFSSSRELRIYKSGDEQPFGNAATSQLYKLDGLPATFSQPLLVSFPSAGKSEGNLIAMGETSFSLSDDGSVTGYRVLETTYTDSTTLAFIPAAPDPVDDGGEGIAVKLINLAGYSSKSTGHSAGVMVTSTAHFKILHIGLSAEAATLGNSLEAAYSKLTAWGFNYDKRTSWPVDVTIFDLAPNRFGVFVPSVWGDNYGTLNFNALRINEVDDLKVTAGHEFFHLIQALYDSRNRYSKAKSPSDCYWLAEAASVWSEREWSGDPDNLSSKVRDGHQRLPFHYFHVPSSGDRPDYHGYGMSSLIQYIKNRAGVSALGQIYTYILEHGNDPVAAINATLSTSLGETFQQWHPDFLEKLIQGDLYGDVTIATAVAYDTATWDIDSSHDTQQDYTYSYGAGGARFFILKLNYQGFTPETTLSLDLPQATGKIVVYKVHLSGITKLEEGTSLYVEHLDEMVTAGDYLMVMVTNEYLGPHYDYDTNQTLSLKISENQGFKFGHVWVSGTATYRVHETNEAGLDTTYTLTDEIFQMQGGIGLDEVPGSTSGDTFTASYDSPGAIDSNHNYAGTISISMDNPDDPTLITDFTINGEVIMYTNGAVENIHTYSCNGSGIPQYYGINGSYDFKLDNDALNHILDATNIKVDYGSFLTEENTWTMLDFTPQYIEIKLDR